MGAQGSASPGLSSATACAFPGCHRRALPPRPSRRRRVVLRDAACLTGDDQPACPHRRHRAVCAAQLFAANAGLSARSTGGKKTNAFVDVPYQDVVRDAPGVIRKCYEAAGIPLDATAMQAMQAWEASNRQHKHGAHRYALADFGITESEVAGVFNGVFGTLCAVPALTATRHRRDECHAERMTMRRGRSGTACSTRCERPATTSSRDHGLNSLLPAIERCGICSACCVARC